MSRSLTATLIALPLLMLFTIHSVVARLNQDTRRMCATQDWPVERHATNAAFCRQFLATAQF